MQFLVVLFFVVGFLVSWLVIFWLIGNFLFFFLKIFSDFLIFHLNSSLHLLMTSLADESQHATYSHLVFVTCSL